MWTRSHLPILVALGISLALHLITFGGARAYHVPMFGPPASPHVINFTLSLKDAPELPPDDPETPTPPDKPDKSNNIIPPPKPTPPELPPPPKPKIKFPDEVGERTGTGIGSSKQEGLKPLKAIEADQDQAFLSQHAGAASAFRQLARLFELPGEDGTGGRPGDTSAQQSPNAQGNKPDNSPQRPSEQVADNSPPAPPEPSLPRTQVREQVAEKENQRLAPAKGQPNLVTAPREKSVEAHDEKPSVDGVIAVPPRQVLAYALLAPSLSPAIQVPTVTEPEIREQKISEKSNNDAPQTDPPVRRETAPAPAAVKPPAVGDGRRPGQQLPGGDPGHPSDTDSDPFSKIATAEVLTDGSLDVRFGRKVKAVRPHIPIVGQVDAFALLNPSVTLRVNIRENGTVSNVTVYKSSGSTAIDQPTLTAMYEWWFEPLKDEKGHAVPDCILFTISFR